MKDNIKKAISIIITIYIVIISGIDLFMAKYPCINNEGLGVQCFNLRNENPSIIDKASLLNNNLLVVLLLNLLVYVLWGILFVMAKKSNKKFLSIVTKINFVIYIIAMISIFYFQIKYMK